MKNILQNKIEQIKKDANLLQNILAQVKIRKRLFEKGLQKIAKMLNLPQNELIQMHTQSRDELEQIAKMRRIKDHETMSKELE